ncbi:MAG: hypothetical protein QNJ40_20455 [Xanthomonadales bacterium]|nr:hypothetical protein [Xanthomonadales bacterium]
MDTLNESEAQVMAAIAGGDDLPLLMMNLNRYQPGQFPGGELYREWRHINAEMISHVGGRILWNIPVHGHILSNGPAQPLDEILAYWYPSHQSFLDMRGSPSATRNFELRRELIAFAMVHRCDGTDPPLVMG